VLNGRVHTYGESSALCTLYLFLSSEINTTSDWPPRPKRNPEVKPKDELQENSSAGTWNGAQSGRFPRPFLPSALSHWLSWHKTSTLMPWSVRDVANHGPAAPSSTPASNPTLDPNRKTARMRGKEPIHKWSQDMPRAVPSSMLSTSSISILLAVRLLPFEVPALGHCPGAAAVASVNVTNNLPGSGPASSSCINSTPLLRQKHERPIACFHRRSTARGSTYTIC
jgi:hypothetical protein